MKNNSWQDKFFNFNEQENENLQNADIEPTANSKVEDSTPSTYVSSYNIDNNVRMLNQESEKPKKKKRIWLRVASIATVLVLVVSSFSVLAWQYELTSDNAGIFTSLFGGSPSNQNTSKNVQETEDQAPKLQVADKVEDSKPTEKVETIKPSENVIVSDSLTLKKDLTISEIAKKCTPSTVGVKIEMSKNGYTTGEGVGSGIVMNKDGYILTNAHVVEGASKLTVVFSDGTSLVAKVIGYDTITDTGVIKIDPKGLALVPAEFGDPKTLEVGDLTVAIGTPYSIDFAGTVTAGVVSALDRKMEVSQNKVLGLIQTDATLNPGNSGGPLINKYGQIVGMNTMKYGMGYFEGLGLAVPIDISLSIANDIIDKGYVTGRPMLGVSGTSITQEEADYYQLPLGVDVISVVVGGPCDKAGIRRGDIITAFNNVEVKTSSDLVTERDKHKAGDIITLTVYRNGESTKIKVVLGEETNS